MTSPHPLRPFAIATVLTAGTALWFTFSPLLGPAKASDDGNHFFGNDERVVVKPLAWPWRAIGRINFAGGGHCTGTLVGPDVVLTAAHCMFEDRAEDDDEESDFVWDPPLYFLAGFHDDRFAAAAHVEQTWLPPEFDMATFAETYDHDHLDFALLRLREPIGQELGWFRLAALGETERDLLLGPGSPKINQAGYSADSKSRMTAHVGCRLLTFEPNDTVLHQCDTMEGDSGSPLFIFSEGHYRVVALESQWLRRDGEVVNSAVDTRAFTEAVERFLSD